MTDGNDLGKILKQRRIMIPLTLRELAASSGVSMSHIGRIERGKRFPSAPILQKIAKPLSFDELELLTLAHYITPQPSTEVESEVDTPGLDPCVAGVLAQEPVKMQHTVAMAGNPAGWPEFREYAHRKYPNLDWNLGNIEVPDEDLITMIENLIKSRKGSDCNIEFAEYAHRKYPELDEADITMVEDIMEHLALQRSVLGEEGTT